MSRLEDTANNYALRVADQATPYHGGIDATHANWQSITGLPYFVNPSGTDIPLWSASTSPLTTKGDILTYSTVPARLAIGANNTVLVADSAAATGNKWSATLAGLTLTTPIIADFTNATHTHTNAAGGGQLNAGSVFSAGQVPLARGGTNADLSATGGANQFLKQTSVGGAVTVAGITSADLTTALTTPPAIGGVTPAAITGTTITANTKFVGPIIQPAADAVAGVQITNAAGSIVITNWDTTNGFVGLGSGMTAPQAALHLGPNGALAQFDGDLITPWFSAGTYSNFIIQSNAFTNVAWIKTGVSVALTATDATLTANAATNVTAGGLSTDGLTQTVTNSTTGAWTFSVWLKAQSGTCNATINIVTDGETPTAKTCALTTTWKRFSVTQTLNVAHTTKTVSITNGTNAIAVWRSQLDQSSYARGYVASGAATIAQGNSFQTFVATVIQSSLSASSLVITTTSALNGKTTLAASTTSAASFVVTAGTAPTSPVEGDHWNDSTQKAMIAFVDGIKQARVGALFTMNASATVASTASETTLVTTGVGTMTLPANFAVVGKTIRIRAWGFYSTTGTPTLQFRVKIGTTVVGDTTAKTTASGVSNGDWYLEMDITVRATGASGNVFAQGRVEQNATTPWPMVNTAVSAAIDTTASKLVDVMATWGTSSSSNTITCSNLSLEVLN